MGNYSKVEIFSLGDKKEMIATKITDEGKSTRKMFAKKISSENKDDDRYLTNIYIEEEGKKTAQLNKNVGISVDPQNTLYTDNWWQLIINSIPATVKKATFNGEECYYIHNFQTPYSLSERGGIYINKKTGLPISTMAYEYTNSDGTRRKMASRRIYIRI